MSIQTLMIPNEAHYNEPQRKRKTRAKIAEG